VCVDVCSSHELSLSVSLSLSLTLSHCLSLSRSLSLSLSLSHRNSHTCNQPNTWPFSLSLHTYISHTHDDDQGLDEMYVFRPKFTYTEREGERVHTCTHGPVYECEYVVSASV